MTRSGPPRTQTAGRSWPVRVLLLFVHRGTRQRRTNPLVGWLLAQSGRDPARAGMAADCRQCGQPYSVQLLRLSPRRARYWCQRCNAVVTLRPPLGIAERPRPPVPPPAAAPPDPAGAEPREVMPPAMLRWVAAGSRRPVTIEGLDKPAMYQLYKRWDAHLGTLTPQALADLAANGEPRPLAGLPPFSTVVGALHDTCYRTDLAVRALLESRPDGDRVRVALSGRAEHARRWLATRARQLCWIVSRLPGGEPAVPDARDVRAAMAALRSGTQPDRVAGHAARAAAFGTDGGPALHTLLAVYPHAELLAALEAYLASGARPLRADVLAHLTAPPGTSR